MSIELYHGDCLELMKSIPDGSVDMVLCDLPYGTTTKNKWDSILPLEEMWNLTKKVIKPNGAILFFGQPPFSSMLIMSNIEMFRYEWIWKKTLPQGFLNSKKMPLRATENISVFYKKLPTYNPQMKKGKPYDKGIRKANCTTNYGDFGETIAINKSGDRYPINELEFSNANHQEIYHPTQKPVPLLEYLIKTYTNENETVLDFTMGSGSTGVACINTNRNFIGIEKDDKYFEIAKKRIEQYKTQGSLF
jgi:DNA modification methylase